MCVCVVVVAVVCNSICCRTHGKQNFWQTKLSSCHTQTYVCAVRTDPSAADTEKKNSQLVTCSRKKKLNELPAVGGGRERERERERDLLGLVALEGLLRHSFSCNPFYPIYHSLLSLLSYIPFPVILFPFLHITIMQTSQNGMPTLVQNSNSALTN